MSFLPIIEYGAGITFFGFMYWILDAIQGEMDTISVRGDVFDLFKFVWVGVLLIYLIFGGIWVAKKYNEEQYGGFN